MIQIQNVSKNFYNLRPLDNISFTIPRGELIGILGPTGAGKTTLLNIIAGLLKPDKGQIIPLNGQWPTIGFKTDQQLFPNQLTIGEYLNSVAELCDIPKIHQQAVIDQTLAQVSLSQLASKKIGACSKAVRQRLGIAQILIGNPSLLLLDEPSNGLDPAAQADIHHHIRAMHALGKTILISSSQMEEVTQLCSYLIIMNRGQIYYQNNMVNALTLSPSSLIETDRPITNPILLAELHAFHPNIQVDGHKVHLHSDAMKLRRDVLAMVLRAGYDVLHVTQNHATLAQMYAEVVRS